MQMPTRDQIYRCNFSELVSLVNEPNTPSGGGASVRRVLELARIGSGMKVLEIGCNTGFSSLEMASWGTYEVCGIDINPRSVALAQEKAKAAQLSNVEFRVANALDLPFTAQSFDLVFASNTTSFIGNHARALEEYYRVLKPRGLLATIPIYYTEEPPAELRRRVEDLVGVPLPPFAPGYWENLLSSDEGTLIHSEEYAYIPQSRERIMAYAVEVVEATADAYDEATREHLIARLAEVYEVFNENLKYARYAILLHRKQHVNRHPILYASKRAS
jgi:ubiquinone/menaquinone biosynthesis C-methylase UbiE